MKRSKSIRRLFTILTICLSSCLMNSCSEETTDNTPVYQIGFSEMDGDLNESSIITDAYKVAIGVNSDEFTLEGDLSSNDERVKAACKVAQTALNSTTFSGYYVIEVNRGTHELHTATYGKKK